jgi:hypothetical protein
LRLVLAIDLTAKSLDRILVIASFVRVFHGLDVTARCPACNGVGMNTETVCNLRAAQRPYFGSYGHDDASLLLVVPLEVVFEAKFGCECRWV